MSNKFKQKTKPSKKEVEKRLPQAQEKLKKLYDKLPETVGCLTYIQKSENEGGCGAHCCKFNNPLATYAEFLNSWQNVLDTWENDDIVNLVGRSISNYLSNKVLKGCVFHDKKTNLCGQHKHRPLACMLYGITSNEEYKPKYEKLKVLTDEAGESDNLYPQCNLIQREDDKGPVTPKESDQLWLELKSIDRFLGFKDKHIKNDVEGTYLSYHDHILMHLFDNNVLRNLTVIKLHGTDDEKLQTTEKLKSSFKEYLEKGFTDDSTNAE